MNQRIPYILTVPGLHYLNRSVHKLNAFLTSYVLGGVGEVSSQEVTDWIEHVSEAAELLNEIGGCWSEALGGADNPGRVHIGELHFRLEEEKARETGRAAERARAVSA